MISSLVTYCTKSALLSKLNYCNVFGQNLINKKALYQKLCVQTYVKITIIINSVHELYAPFKKKNCFIRK